MINVQGVADRPRVDPRYVMRNFKPPREGEADYSAPPGFRCSGAPARSRGSGGKMGCAVLRRSVFRWLERDSTSMLFFFFLFFLQFLRENKQHDNHIELHLCIFLVGEAKLRFQMKKNRLSCRTARRFRESNSFPAPPLGDATFGSPDIPFLLLEARRFHLFLAWF